MANTDLTPERLRELLHYDPETGKLAWLVTSSNRAPKGSPSGALSNGYLITRIDGTLYKTHRLAWLWVYGEWPAGLIDHIDGDRSNNAIANLREATSSLNLQNQRRARSNSKSGVLGVSWDRARSKWIAQIKVGGKSLNLGRFQILEQAHSAYLDAKRRMHEGCTI